jgi:hypothetical protein
MSRAIRVLLVENPEDDAALTFPSSSSRVRSGKRLPWRP